MSNTYLSLGGNQGDKKYIFNKTIQHIESLLGDICVTSSVYETESWGFQSSLFWNCVVMVETGLTPREVLHTAMRIESYFDRKRGGAGYETRQMDIDILFYDTLVINEEGLIIPHPLMMERRFVLAPLSEIAPEFVHPVTGTKIKDALSDCNDVCNVKKIV